MDKSRKPGQRDSELEELWREGIDEAQYEALLERINSDAGLEPPRGLREALLRIADASSEEKDVSLGFAAIFTRMAPVAIILLVVISVSSYFMYQRGAQSRVDARADRYIQGLLDDQAGEDMFDEDVLLLERLT